jgi:hypothetical protein
MVFIGDDLVGRPLVDRDGAFVGQVTSWYRYPADLDLPFGVAAVRIGRLIRSTHLVDLSDALLDEQALAVIYPAELVRTAPNHRPMVGNTLSPDHAADVLAHYRASMSPA